MTEPIVIGHGATKWLKDSSTVMFSLSQLYGQSTPNALYKGATVYKPATGKKFIILRMTIVNGNSNPRSLWIRYNTIINSSVGTQIFFSNIPQVTTMNIDTYLEIPSNNYINSDSDYNNCTLSSCLGVEVDN